MNLENFDFTEAEILYIKGVEIEALKFQFDRDKLNPFSLERIRLSMYMQMYSKYLGRDIVSINDACSHAKYHTRDLDKLWKVGLSKHIHQIRNDNKAKQDINYLATHIDWHKARLKLKEARALRDFKMKQVKDQWDAYIKILHEEFLTIDNSDRKGEQNV